MKEYIEREALIKEGWLLQRTVYGNGSATIESKQLKDIPTADVVPVVRAYWKSVPNKRARVCSRCEADEPYKFADDDANVYNFCPNCGAKMDGGVNDAAD